MIQDEDAETLRVLPAQPTPAPPTPAPPAPVMRTLALPTRATRAPMRPAEPRLQGKPHQISQASGHYSCN
jgi:hypothetical protein